MHQYLTPPPLLALLLASCIVASAEEPASQPKLKPKPTAQQQGKPLVQKISPDTYQIGKITLNKTTREISLPARSNLLPEGTPLEFLLVHINGEKIHESLLITEIDPTNLNIALKLLNYKESQELFRPLLEDGTRGENEPIVANNIRKAARFTIHVSWKDQGKQKTAPITNWLQHRITGKPMPNTPWVYNGSYMNRGKYMAKIYGNVFAIFSNESAIANYPGADREDDTLWLSSKNIADEGVPITITIKPWSGKLLPQTTPTKN